MTLKIEKSKVCPNLKCLQNEYLSKLMKTKLYVNLLFQSSINVVCRVERKCLYTVYICVL